MHLKLTDCLAIGFDYHFNSLEGDDEDELAKAFMKIFEAGQQPTMFSRLRHFIPLLKIMVSAHTGRSTIFPCLNFWFFSPIPARGRMQGASRRELTDALSCFFFFC